MDYNKIAETAILAGQIMLESHAESYRVEDTTRHILKTSGLAVTEVMTNTTGIFLTLADPDKGVEPITLLRRIDQRSNRLNRIYRVNNVSRQLTRQEIDIDQAYQELLEINQSTYNVFSKDIATIIMVVGFVVLLGGSWADILISPIIGLIVANARIIRKTFYLNNFIYGSAATFITSIIVYILGVILPWNVSTELLIIAGFMPLYPGTVVTNGIRDMLKGDYISGVARITDAAVTAVSLAIGVAVGILVFREVFTWLM